MLRIAIFMLIRDTAKYAMLVCGLTFCALLMSQQSSVFCGIMIWASANVQNMQAPIWVMDASVEQVNEVTPLRDIEVQRVRSVPGVQWAVPLYWGLTQARLEDGSFQQIQLTGLDTATLVGRPGKILQGRIEDLRLPNAVIADQVAVEKFAKKGIKLQIGTTFEINDKQARVVALCHSRRSFFGQPYIFTTFDRAMEYAPVIRKRLSFILAQPKPGLTAREVAERISRIDGLRAVAREDFQWQTIIWYIRNTGIPISFGTVVILGIVVGIAISGQTFYLFIHENLRYLAALKAMGADMVMITKMVFLQALLVGFIGFGIGVGLAAAFGNLVMKKGQPPFFMPWQVLAFTGGIIIFICCLSALVGIRKVALLEPAVVFK